MLIQSDLKRSSCNNINWVLSLPLKNMSNLDHNNEYKVLARKYRPKLFSELVGQNTLVEILSNAISKSRIPNAYVLTGVRGVGKTTTARLIALSLNCLNRAEREFEPCNNCESCLSLKSEKNMDVIEMDAASNTSVEDIRELLETIKYKPLLGKFKIFIIDEVHMLSKSAFNALLKTLEEPPDHIKFIFATTEIKKIPLTVLSRCQRFDLRRVNNDSLSKHLKDISKLEKINLEEDALALIIRAADGSVRDALSFLDQATSNTNNVNAKNVTDMLGLADRGKIFDLLDEIMKGNTSESLDKYRELYNLGADVNMIFDEMLNIVHFLTELKISPNLEKDIYIPELERTKGSSIASKLTLNDLGLLWQIIFKGFQELQNSLHLYQHGEMIILRLLYLNDNDLTTNKVPNSKTEDINNNANINLENKSQNVEIKKKNDYLINNKSQSSVKNSNLNKIISINDFRNFVEMFYLNREGIIHSKLYNNAKLVQFEEGEVTLNIDEIHDNNFTRTVSKLISKWTGRIWKINTSSSNICKSLHEEDIINQQREIEIMKNNTVIKKILQEIPGSSIHSISDLAEIDNSLTEIKIKKEK